MTITQLPDENQLPDEVRGALQLLNEYAAAHERKRPNSTRPARFAIDLGYLHERLYRTLSGVVVSDDPFALRLDSARGMLTPLRPSDFPRDLRDAFTAITDTPAPSEDAARQALHDLVKLFLALSERVVNGAALGDQYEQAAWCVLEAREGRPEPLRCLVNNYRKWHQPLPASVVTFRSERAKGLPVRRGRTSLHPAREIAIARLVRDRLAFQKLHHPKTSLNATCKCIASFIGLGPGTPKAAYLSVYRP